MAEVAYTIPAATKSHPTAWRGRCQGTTAPQIANATAIVKLATTKAWRAMWNGQPTLIVMPTATKTSTTANPARPRQQASGTMTARGAHKKH